MAVTQNLKGTSYPSFKIHKQGPTFYQGTVAPNISAVNGDMYIQHGTGGAVWIYNQGWSILETGANDAVDVFEIYNSVQPTSTQKMYILQGETTNATETILSPESTFSIDTTSLTLDDIGITTDSGSSVGKIIIPSDTSGIVEARVVARDSTNNENAGYLIKGVIVNHQGTTVLLTDPTEEILGESTSSWYALIEAGNNGTDSLDVKVSGSANATVNWTAFVQLTLVYSQPQYSLSSNVSSVAEGESVTYTLTTRSISDGTTVPYTITGIDQADLSAGNLTGNFTVTNNTATLTFTLAEDATTEGTENMTLALDNGLASADVVVVSDTSLTPTYSLSADNTTINEGDTVTFTLTTANVADGTNIAYTVTGIDANDLSSGSLTGNITVNSNTGTAAFTLAEDTSTEGQEVMTLTLDNGGGALDVVITDSSTAPAGTPNPVVEYTLDNPDAYGTSAGDFYGSAVAMTDTHAIVGAYGEEDANGIYSGKAYIYDLSTGNVTYTLDNPNSYGTGENDYFGSAVAISDSYAIVGAYGEDASANNQDMGKAYIYDLSNGNLVQTLNNPDPFDTTNRDEFGWSVGINDTYAIVGSPGQADANTGSGKVYIFNVSNGSIAYTINNPNAHGTSQGNRFGYDVAISNTHAIASAYLESDASGIRSGKAYIFDLSNGSLVYTLDNPNPYGTSEDDYFGWAVAISSTHAIVAAKQEDEAGAFDSGKAYIYDLSDGSLAYTLDNPNAYDAAEGDYFGTAVAITDSYAIVSANFEDDAGGSSSGKAYIYDLSDGSLVATLDNPNAFGTSSNDWFGYGYSVAISSTKAIVGAPGEDDAEGANGGKAYIFDLNISSGGGSGNVLSGATPSGSSTVLAGTFDSQINSVHVYNNGQNAIVSGRNSSGANNYGMVEIEMSTPYDISTASATTNDFWWRQAGHYGSTEPIPNADSGFRIDGFSFNDDGTRMYIGGETSNYLYQYILTTPYNIDNHTWQGAGGNLDNGRMHLDRPGYINVTAKDFAFNSDGTQIHVLVNVGRRIWTWNLSSAYDLSTASYSHEYDFTTDVANIGHITGFGFTNNGETLWLQAGVYNDADVYQYDLSTAYDTSTMTYNSSALVEDIQTLEWMGPPVGSGYYPYVFDVSGENIYMYDVNQYTLGTNSGSDGEIYWITAS